MVVEVSSLNLEDLMALRNKVKARAPQRFAKTLCEVAWQATLHRRQSVALGKTGALRAADDIY